MERGLGNHPKRIGLLLAQAGRIAFRIVHPSLGVHPVTGGIERLAENRTDLGRQPPADHDHTVIVLIHVQQAALLPVRV